MITDTLWLNQAICKAAEGERQLELAPQNPNSLDGIYYLDGPLVLPSGFTLILNNCTVKMVDGVYANMIITKGAYDKASLKTELSDIHIVGKGKATLDQGEPNDLTEKTAYQDNRPGILRNCPILIRNVNGLEISNLHIRNQRYWGITLYGVRNGVICDIDFYADNRMPNQDGIDLRVGCNYIKILDIHGVTGDDSVALTALPAGDSQMLVEGKDADIHHVEIGRISTYISGGHQTVRLLNHDHAKLYNIHVHDVRDERKEGQNRARATVVIGDTRYYKHSPAEWGETHDILVEHIQSCALTGLEVRWNNVANLTYRNIKNTCNQEVLIAEEVKH